MTDSTGRASTSYSLFAIRYSLFGSRNRIIPKLIDNGIPIPRTMRSGLGKAAPAKHTSNDEIEITMRNKDGDAVFACARDQNVGGVCRPLSSAAVVLDARVETH